MGNESTPLNQSPEANNGNSESMKCFCTCFFTTCCILLLVTCLFFFILWLVFHPINLKTDVIEASLGEFNLRAKNSLDYNLRLNISIRNPNRRIGVHYNDIEVDTFYYKEMLGNKSFRPFYQSHKNTSILHLVLVGIKSSLGKDEASKVKQEKAARSFSIDVNINVRARYKPEIINIFLDEHIIFTCELKVPFRVNVRRAVGFQTTKCKEGRHVT